MTAEELIIEHFEGTLSLEQEGELTQVLAASPEARAMYDRYLRVDDVLAGDVASTAPSNALDERVLAAALGAIGGTIGGGTAAWFGGLGGKVAAVFTVVAVGGLSVLFLTSEDPDPVKPASPVASPTNPAPVATPAPSVATPSEETVAPVTLEPPIPAEEFSRTAPAARRSTSTATPDTRAGRRASTTRRTTTTPAKPGLKLDNKNPTVITKPPVIKDPKKNN